MDRVKINEAQARLGELVDSLYTNGEVLITRDGQPVARLTSANGQPSLRNITPSSVGAVLKPLAAYDDLLSEMLA